MNDPTNSDSSESEESAQDPEAVLADAMRAFAELGRINLADNDMQQVLARVAELAKATIPGVREVSVTLVSDGQPGTPAYTGEMALQLDETQYEAGWGPCLDAALKETVHLIPDMTAESRWPEFTAEAIRHGANSSLSVGLPIHATVAGALNIYADQPGVFDQDAVELAQTFAGYAAVAMANANLYATTAALAEQMKQAMSSRAVIEQAKGILMAQQRVGEQEAFDLLSAASQTGNRKLREIAQAIVDAAQG